MRTNVPPIAWLMCFVFVKISKVRTYQSYHAGTTALSEDGLPLSHACCVNACVRTIARGPWHSRRDVRKNTRIPDKRVFMTQPYPHVYLQTSLPIPLVGYWQPNKQKNTFTYVQVRIQLRRGETVWAHHSFQVVNAKLSTGYRQKKSPKSL